MERLTERDEHGDLYVKEHDYISASKKLAEYEDTGLTPDQILQLKKECDWYGIVGEVVREVENKLERIKNKNECLKKFLELALQEIERFYELNSSIKIVTFKLPEIKFDLTLDENDRQIWKYANDVKEILKLGNREEKNKRRFL